MTYCKQTQYCLIGAVLFVFVITGIVFGECMSQAASLQVQRNDHLRRAKIYLAARDYRRAVEACQRNIDQRPSVESYVYLLYVYHAIDGYLEWLAQQDHWGAVGRLSLSMVNRGTMDLVDPPDMLSRMAKEILQEGLRQQFDIAAGMANHLDKPQVDKLWLERKAWEKSHPNTWWSDVPQSWNW